MYTGIQKLPPGNTLELDESGQLKIAPYWDLAVVVDDDIKPREYYVRTYRELLEQCVSSHLMSDVPLGVFLSGGLEFSAGAATHTQKSRGPIRTISVGYGEAG